MCIPPAWEPGRRTQSDKEERRLDPQPSPFPGDDAVANNPADFVRVDPIGTQPDGIGGDQLSSQVMLCHDDVAHHAASFTNVKLVRPAARIHEFIPRKAESLHVGPHPGRDSRVGGQKMQKAAVVVFVLFCDLIPLRIAGFGPGVACSGQVSTKRRGIEIPLLMRQGIVLGEPPQGPCRRRWPDRLR